ncbi:MAG: hypothetical protein ACI9WU_002244 [Myxococcota bacterium]|jgi:hypothetical protein
MKQLLTLTLAGFLALACSAEGGEDLLDPNGNGVGGKFDQFGDNETGDNETGDNETGDNETGDNETGDNETEAPADPWADAKDITMELVQFPDDLVAPSSYDYPQTSGSPFGMGGTEFWQKWSGGESPSYSYHDGSDFGRRCMYAAARRLEVLAADPPEALVRLEETSNWNGRFFNWNDDYGNDESWGDASGARLWAWRTSLVKFISQTAQNGDCYLPTYEMMELLAEDCQARADNGGGEIQGCRAP